MSTNRCSNRSGKACFLACILFAFAVFPVAAKTRWSSLHIVPDADLFASGEFALGFDGYVVKNYSDKMKFAYTVPIRFGITEWVNLDLAYCGGMSVGIKGRILGETNDFLPSLAIGVHNIFNHKEANYFLVDSADNIEGEVYLVFSKSVETIKTRLHAGIQSIPTSKSDKINPFFAVEKYFGLGFYSSLEFYRRDKSFILCLFANWRLLNDHLELSAGAVDLQSMFLNDDNKFSVSLEPTNPGRFAKPGVWIGLKFHGKFGIGSTRGFMSAEDRMKKQDQTIEMLVEEYDSLKVKMNHTLTVLEDVRGKMGMLIDSVVNDPKRLENVILEKLITLKTLYTTEPYDPERVRLLTREIASFREKAVPTLEGILLDIKADRYLRTYSAVILGEIGNTASSDVLLDVLARTNDPDLKIEILIALGKMKETRAMYLMEQLANSPNDAIAITAQDVLLRLSKTTGAEISADLKMRNIPVDEEKALIESKRKAVPDTLHARDTTATYKDSSVDGSRNRSDVSPDTKGAAPDTAGAIETPVKEPSAVSQPAEPAVSGENSAEVQKTGEDNVKKQEPEADGKSDKKKRRKEKADSEEKEDTKKVKTKRGRDKEEKEKSKNKDQTW